ncbi:MAG: metallophosphoesterase family protein, partial [Planctomycetota bacterium]|nr:metallophosphoesterase family protein [Planctomycetota bacterium]
DEIGHVEYGPTPAYGLTAPAEKKRRLRWDGTMRNGGAWVARARLTGLAPDTKYYYRVALGSVASGEGTFRTAPAGDGTGFTFLVFADTIDNKKEHFRITTIAGAMFDPAFVLHCGDAISEKADKVRDFRPVFLHPVVRTIKDTFGDGDFSDGSTWKSEFFPTARPLLAEVPYFLARGNHEGKNKRMALYFEAPDGTPQGRCYGFDWGAAHFVTVNTNRNFKPGSVQHAFLESDLSSSTKPFKVFFAHHPPYSSARHGSTFRVRKYIRPLLEAHGVKLAFAGHDHSYQRTVVNGVTYV